MAKDLTWLKAVTLALGLCWLGHSAATAPQAAGYLPSVGPAPLRFETRPFRGARVQLPPLSAETGKNGNALQTNTPAGGGTSGWSEQNSVPLRSDVFVTSEPDPEGAFAFWPAPIASPSRSPVSDFDPQAMINYLAPIPTNGGSGKVLVPLFVPPLPPQPVRSSRATYESR